MVVLVHVQPVTHHSVTRNLQLFTHDRGQMIPISFGSLHALNVPCTSLKHSGSTRLKQTSGEPGHPTLAQGAPVQSPAGCKIPSRYQAAGESPRYSARNTARMRLRLCTVGGWRLASVSAGVCHTAGKGVAMRWSTGTPEGTGDSSTSCNPQTGKLLC